MLGLVAFGYFYTVRPVYQKDLLEEDVARLRLESSKLDRQTAKLRGELGNLRSQRKSLLAQNSLLSSERKELRSQTVVMRERVLKLSTDLGTVSARNQEQQEQLKEGQMLLLSDAFAWEVGRSILRIEFDQIPFRESQDISEWVAAKQHQPIQIVLSTIDEQLKSGKYFGLPPPHDLSRSLINDLRARVVAVSSELQCPVADRDEWSRAYKEQIAEHGRNLDGCVEMHAQHLASKEGWSPARLAAIKKTPYWIEQSNIYRRACDVYATYSTAKRFNESWSAYIKPCVDLVVYAEDIAFGKRQANRNFGSTKPPTIDRKWYADWFDEGDGADK